ncbi:serine--tRNA ligase [Candidatus Liberibacter americanus]|uniref:Serine--tRNA ligase n=1 Tax=Candidatus Liberibacter americanus str. Sao Paulo TaxID=1261131 RepID=U6B7H8_9HYPH|nr:serine--tRNA ligase [Candidatus Liberibacter americanus]AHA27682.1 Seryl-tRNA synthetase [Candidatus Liberibacter americanus str. Sao Paulo]EMS36390.1 seryl-tRNA synthetase [Candidatus Liberibacter americanus PW_SP]
MLDIQWIRNNPKDLDIALEKRGIEKHAEHIVNLDKKRRSLIKKIEEMRANRNSNSEKIGQAISEGDTNIINKLKAEVSNIKEQILLLEKEENEISSSLNKILSYIPNIPMADVPIGKSEEENVILRHLEAKRKFKFNLAKSHFEIGEELGLMDFERAAKLSGARFSILTNHLALLERALGQFMLDVHTLEHGYTEVSVPLLVRDKAMYGTGQLPKFKEDMFCTNDGRWLIPTAEVSLTNLVSDEIIDIDRLPLRFVSLTPSFRSEAGSAGRDTRGMLRQHQFWKCELVSITNDEGSITEHERMTSCAEKILKKLELAYRVVSICSGDLGFSARKTYDIEVWLPGQNLYREISSCSNCGDFQARRMNSKYRDIQKKSLKFTHTLNGSGVAVGRCLIAILENYLNEDGSVTVPTVLQKYMNNLKVIEKQLPLGVN